MPGAPRLAEALPPQQAHLLEALPPQQAHLVDAPQPRQGRAEARLLRLVPREQHAACDLRGTGVRERSPLDGQFRQARCRARIFKRKRTSGQAKQLLQERSSDW